MSEKPSSAFNHKDGVTLKEYFEALLRGVELRTEQARLTMEKRLDGMNEFREQSKDQAARSPTREEVNARFDAIEKDIRLLNTFKDNLTGVATQKDVSGAKLIGIAGLSMAILSFALRLFGM